MLSEWQQHFASALTDPDQDHGIIEDMVNTDSRHQRLNIYRNNVTYSLTEALKALYPVIHTLIGDQAFTYLARRFVAHTLPDSGTLIGYGKDFANCIDRLSQQHNALQSVPYLADVARLEYALHLSFHAAERSPLLPEQVQRLDSEQLPDARLLLQPSACLLQSCWPVAAIWHAHQHSPIDCSTIDLTKRSYYLCIIRMQQQLEVRTMAAPDWHFLTYIQQGDNIATGNEKTIRKYPDFSLERLFQSILFEGVFHDILPSSEHIQGEPA